MNKIIITLVALFFSANVNAVLLTTNDRNEFLQLTDTLVTETEQFDTFGHGDAYTHPFIRVFSPTGGSSVIIEEQGNTMLTVSDTLGFPESLGIGQQLIFGDGTPIRGVGFTLIRPAGNPAPFDFNDVEFFADGVAISTPLTTIASNGGVFFGLFNDDDEVLYTNIVVRFNNDHSLGYVDDVFVVTAEERMVIHTVPNVSTLLLALLGFISLVFIARRKQSQ